MIRHLAYLLILLSAVQNCSEARAQSLNNTFTLTVPSVMTLRALRGPQFRNHPNTNANVTFTNSVWLARTAAMNGSTVTFTTDHAFQSVGAPAQKRDVQLRLPFMFVSPGSGWAMDTNVDQTNYAAGDETAMVQVSSQTAGTALIFMNVTFITGDVSTLVGGTYDVTVTGTISQN